jgi:hypothetical protein
MLSGMCIVIDPFSEKCIARSSTEFTHEFKDKETKIWRLVKVTS